MAVTSRFFLFALHSGRKRLAYGRTADEARRIMAYRMTPEEMAQLGDEQPKEIRQQEIQQHIRELG